MYSSAPYARRPKKLKYDMQMEKHLCSYEVLNEMRFLSIKARTNLIRQRFELDISA